MLSPACWFTWCHCFGWIWHLMLFYQLPTTINNNNNKPGWSCIQSVCCIVCHLASHLLTYIQCGVWTCGCGILVGFSLLNWFYILLYMQDLERGKKKKKRATNILNFDIWRYENRWITANALRRSHSLPTISYYNIHWLNFRLNGRETF